MILEHDASKCFKIVSTATGDYGNSVNVSIDSSGGVEFKDCHEPYSNRIVEYKHRRRPIDIFEDKSWQAAPEQPPKIGRPKRNRKNIKAKRKQKHRKG